jgi:hypothetical protein
MKKFENLNTRRKLASFGFVIPHDDHTAPKNIGGIYSDLIEFSRSEFLGESVGLELIAFTLDRVYIPNQLHDLRGNCFIPRYQMAQHLI